MVDKNEDSFYLSVFASSVLHFNLQSKTIRKIIKNLTDDATFVSIISSEEC